MKDASERNFLLKVLFLSNYLRSIRGDYNREKNGRDFLIIEDSWKWEIVVSVREIFTVKRSTRTVFLSWWRARVINVYKKEKRRNISRRRDIWMDSLKSHGMLVLMLPFKRQRGINKTDWPWTSLRIKCGTSLNVLWYKLQRVHWANRIVRHRNCSNWIRNMCWLNRVWTDFFVFHSTLFISLARFTIDAAS